MHVFSPIIGAQNGNAQLVFLCIPPCFCAAAKGLAALPVVAAAACAAMSSAASALDAEGGVGTDAFAIPRAEFAKYYREITGKTAPDGLVEFAIDPKVSKSGNDAYRIVSTDKMSVVPVCGCATDKMSVVPVGAADTGKTGVSPVCVTITGSNLRSVLYVGRADGK